MTTTLERLLADLTVDTLFSTKEGMKFIAGAVNNLRNSARYGCATIRMPEIRDHIPSHIRADILKQSYELFEFVGRCDLAIITLQTMVERQYPPEFEKAFREVFAALYTHACEQEDGLKKLCKLAVETYKPDGVTVDYTRAVDKEF